MFCCERNGVDRLRDPESLFNLRLICVAAAPADRRWALIKCSQSDFEYENELKNDIFLSVRAAALRPRSEQDSVNCSESELTPGGRFRGQTVSGI